MPPSTNTAAIVDAAFRQYGNMTIAQVAQRTHLHTERIRRHVKEPRYKHVDSKREGRNTERIWQLVER